MFSVRGAGQLVQQADAALVLSKLDPPTIEPDCKQIAIVHAKARTSVEIPTFVTQFQEHDGIAISMTYHSQYIESAVKAYSTSGKDPTHLDAMIMEFSRRSTGMSPTGSGIRSSTLIPLILSEWKGEKDKPSPAVMEDRLKSLAATGEIISLDDSNIHGALYQLPNTPSEGGTS